jgi:nucleoside phosphorylase
MSHSKIDLILVPQGAEYQVVKNALIQVKNDQIPQILAIPIGSPSFSPDLLKLLENIPNLEKIQNVLVMGLCGSLSFEYAIADIAIYKDCFNPNIQASLTCDRELIDYLRQKLENARLVTALTSDRPIHLATEKRFLHQTSAAAVVDMEGYPILEMLTRLNISVGMVRAVSDDAKYDLPDLSKAIDRAGNLKGLDMAIAFLQKPPAALRALQTLSTVTKNIFS